MSIRLQMLAAAGRAKNILADSAQLVANFTAGQINHDGGFRGRTKDSDLYYTVFGLETLLALDANFNTDKTSAYLIQFETGRSLDLVHLACLLRCKRNLSKEPLDKSFCAAIAQRIEEYRTDDGGYNSKNAPHGTAYDSFLALGAYQDMNIRLPDSTSLINCIESLQTPEGGYSNESTAKIPLTPPTAAALTIMKYFNADMEKSAIDWLLERCIDTGGFTVSANIKMPDLLSTATALHALSANDVPTENIKDKCLDFIDSLWNSSGGFYPNWADKIIDCEYTYYGLLAIGYLCK